MSEETPRSGEAGGGPVAGTMLLYSQPQLLAREEHAHLGLRERTAPFAFAREARAIPIVAGEFISVQKHYPIVFYGNDVPAPFAVVGILEDENLFVDDAGNWAVPGYIPAYLRCYPFALATAAEDRYAVVFDAAAPMVSEHPDVPFFQGAEIAPQVQQRIDFCRSYEAEKQRTRAIGRTLQRLELLTPQQATRTTDGEDEAIANYLAVDRNKLQALSGDMVASLFHDGTLASIIAHLFSLENFSELTRRRALRNAGQSNVSS